MQYCIEYRRQFIRVPRCCYSKPEREFLYYFILFGYDWAIIFGFEGVSV